MGKAPARKTAPKKRSTTRKPAASAANAGVRVVNIIPQSLSGETNQDSEPMLAVNPNNVDHMVATAFTPDPANGPMAPYFASSDGGATWTLNAVAPGGEITGDITVAFSGTGDKLYGGILRQDSPNFYKTRMNILRTDDFKKVAPMTVLVDRLEPDQPFTQAATVGAGAHAGKERVYVGNNDLAARPKSATLDFSLDAGAVNPTINQVRLEHRGTSGQNGPQVRTSLHPDGTVYAAFYGWRATAGIFDANTLVVTADVVVSRDDAWGEGASPFQVLADPADNLPGLRVVQDVHFAFNRSGTNETGQQRIGGALAISVDPRPQRSGTVYLAWGADEAGVFAVHVRSSNNRGAAWSATDLLTLKRATNASLAVNDKGVVALLYQQLTGSGPAQRWETHVRRSADGGANWSDIVLATTPSNVPSKSAPGGFDPYLGDYAHILSVGSDFYGVFSASNIPDRKNFPSGVVYQRNADFTARRLLDLDKATEVQVSIDPFFFKLTG